MALIKETKDKKQDQLQTLLIDNKKEKNVVDNSSERVTIYLNKEIHKKLQLLRVNTRISVSKLIEQAVKEKYSL